MTTLSTTPDALNSAAEPQSPTTLRESVTNALSNYFSQLDDQTATNDIYNTMLAEIEIPLLETIMDYTQGNQSKTAIYLGISRGTLRKKLKIYNML